MKTFSPKCEEEREIGVVSALTKQREVHSRPIPHFCSNGKTVDIEVFATHLEGQYLSL